MRMIQKESDKSDKDKSGEWKRKGRGNVGVISRQKQTKLLLKWREEGPTASNSVNARKDFA